MSTYITQVLKENIWSILSTVFLSGIMYGSIRIENSWRDARINSNQDSVIKIESKDEVYDKRLTENQFMITLNNQQIIALQNDNKSAQKDISDIKARIDVIGNKIDNMTDLLKKMDRNNGNNR